MAEIAKAKQALQRFAEQSQLTPSVLQAAELALDELLTNVVAYGHAGTDTNAIELTFELEGDALKILVSDSGIAFDPFATRLPPPGSELSLEQRELGGHGIQLVKKSQREPTARIYQKKSYRVRRSGRRTIVWVAIHC